MRAAVDHLGGLDVLVNNAGVGVTARLVDTPLADYDRVMNVNVRGYLLYAQHAYSHLARQRGWHEVALHAQASAIDFYLRHDFIPQGARFVEAGIEHQAMHRIVAGPLVVSTPEDAAATVADALAGATRTASTTSSTGPRT